MFTLMTWFYNYLESTAQISNALERLTSPQTNYNIPSLARVTNRVVTATSRLRMKTRNPESPIPIDILNKILYVSREKTIPLSECLLGSLCSHWI